MNMGHWCKHLRLKHTPRVVESWLQEFGYQNFGDDALLIAASTRGERITSELAMHAERMAERATMGAMSIAGRARVIR